jgi:hypothetical protein
VVYYAIAGAGVRTKDYGGATMLYDNYSVYVLIAERGVSEDAFAKAVRERAWEVGAETIIFVADYDGYMTAYLVAPATNDQRSRGIIISFQDALQFIFGRERFLSKEEAEEADLPLLYTERVKGEEG